jgi:hypothetical protein
MSGLGNEVGESVAQSTKKEKNSLALSQQENYTD